MPTCERVTVEIPEPNVDIVTDNCSATDQADPGDTIEFTVYLENLGGDNGLTDLAFIAREQDATGSPTGNEQQIGVKNDVFVPAAETKPIKVDVPLPNRDGFYAVDAVPENQRYAPEGSF